MKNNTPVPQTAVCLMILLTLLVQGPLTVSASPWAEKETYGEKVSGKFVFGLKHTLFSWMNPWAEAHDSKYETHWTGFCAGIGKAVVYTAAGAVQLVTFPIPVDFPDIGLGMHIPANHQGGRKGKSSIPSASSAPDGQPDLDEMLDSVQPEAMPQEEIEAPSSEPVSLQ